MRIDIRWIKNAQKKTTLKTLKEELIVNDTPNANSLVTLKVRSRNKKKTDKEPKKRNTKPDDEDWGN